MYLREAEFDSIVAKRDHEFLWLRVSGLWSSPFSVSDFPNELQESPIGHGFELADEDPEEFGAFSNRSLDI